MGTNVLLNLVGGIALLLWGLHMVQSGILRAFGADLRRVLAITLRNRFAAHCWPASVPQRFYKAVRRPH